MKAFRAPSVDPADGSGGLVQTASGPNGEAHGEFAPTGSHGKIVDLLTASPTSCWGQSGTGRKCAHDQDVAGARPGCADAILTPSTPPFHPRSLPHAGFNSENSNTEMATRAAEGSLTLSVEIDENHQDIAEPEDSDIAAVDWLEAADAMSDAAHAP